MKLRIILLGIFILINSNLIYSQVFPLGLQIPNLLRSGYSNNIAPQQSNSNKRAYLPTNREKLFNDSIINARTSNSNLSSIEIDTALISLRKKIFGYSIFNNKIGVFEPNLKIAVEGRLVNRYIRWNGRPIKITEIEVNDLLVM